MNHPRFFALVAAATVLALSGCGGAWVEAKKVDYKSATKVPPLEVPPDLTAPATDDRFAVPDAVGRGSATYSEYAGERSGQTRAAGAEQILPSAEKVRLQRAGTQRWLVVDAEPEKIWPVVREFWTELGFIINVENPATGVMETDWAENRAKIPEGGLRSLFGKFLDNVYSTGERDRFRTRLERGAQPGTTEIYISHRGMVEVGEASFGDSERFVWQPRPPDPELEADMLRRLMVRLGVEEGRAQQQIAAVQQIPPRAQLATGRSGISSLELQDGFDRAWRRVGLALDRVGFTVEDRDRSKGLYFVRYVDPDADLKNTQKKGFFEKLNPFSGGDKKGRPEQYQIQVEAATAGTEVNVLNKDGGPASADVSKRILNLLYEQLK